MTTKQNQNQSLNTKSNIMEKKNLNKTNYTAFFSINGEDVSVCPLGRNRKRAIKEAQYIISTRWMLLNKRIEFTITNDDKHIIYIAGIKDNGEHYTVKL